MVKRYEDVLHYEPFSGASFECTMEEHPQGSYVKYTDYMAVKAELDAYKQRYDSQFGDH